MVKAQKHLQHASGNIDDLLTRRTNAIERTLRQIELSDEDLHIDLLDVPEEREDHEN